MIDHCYLESSSLVRRVDKSELCYENPCKSICSGKRLDKVLRGFNIKGSNQSQFPW